MCQNHETDEENSMNYLYNVAG